MQKRTFFRIAIAVAVIGAVASSVFGGASASSKSRPPGVSAGVAALGRLPVAQALPPDVSAWVEHEAWVTGSDVAALRKGVRVLRADLGSTAVYALRAPNGATCFLMRRVLSLCPAAATAGDPGIQWAVSGGVPGSQVPAIVGIVGDNVKSVKLVTADGSRTLPIINNAIFAALPQLEALPTAPISLIIQFDDSTSNEVVISPR